MGVDFNFNLSSDSKFNQYRKDVEKIKTVIEIRRNNPVYWYKVTPSYMKMLCTMFNKKLGKLPYG